MRIRLNEAQLSRLLEVVGSFPDGQTDMFMTTQDEIDQFRKEGNDKLEKILREVELESGWAHDKDRDVDKGDSILHKCYPMGYFYKSKPVYRHIFIERLTDRIPKEYINILHPMTAVRPEDWYVDVSIKKL
jgi:hypothetical protein